MGRNRIRELPATIDSLDATWDGEFEDPRHDRCGLLITLHPGQLSQVEEFALNLDSKAREVAPEFNFRHEIRTFDVDLHQLRFSIEGEVFPESAARIDTLLQWSRRDRLVTNYRSIPETMLG